MKQTSSSKDHLESSGCGSASCGTCDDCKVVKLEERRGELKPSTPQLYSKEADFYSFYYNMNTRQSS